MDRWRELADRMLAAAAARIGDDARLLECLVMPIAGIVDPADLAELSRCAPPTTSALTQLLNDARHRHAVKSLIIAARCVPEPLLHPMLVAAAQTLDPSCNRDYVIPCTMTFGRRRVVTALLDIAASGSNPMKVGSVNALYWAWLPPGSVSWPDANGPIPPTPPDDSIEDLRVAFLAWGERELEESDDIDFRRVLQLHMGWARTSR